MEAVADPHGSKRTSMSINQLLNPIGANAALNPPAAYPGPSAHGPVHALPSAHGSHPNGGVMHPGSASFSLRAASWEAPKEEEAPGEGRNAHTSSTKEGAGAASTCMYQPSTAPGTGATSPPQGVYMNPMMAQGDPRMAAFAKGQAYFNGAGWGEPGMMNMPYGMVPFFPSPEQTAAMMSNMMPSGQSSPPMNGQKPPSEQHARQSPTATQAPVPAAYQASDRASVRLAARNTTPLAAQPHPYAFSYVPYPYPHPQMGWNMAAMPMPMPGQPQFVQPPKRSASEEGENGAPKKAKKGKAKEEPAKRAPSKKRDSAQNGVDKSTVRAGDGDMNSATPAPGGPAPVVHPELQFARCMSNRYKTDNFPRCVSCTRRWAGDTCRFQGIRFFLKNSEGKIIGVSFVDGQKPDAPNLNFPSIWNVPIKLPHIKNIKRTVAKALLPTLRQEAKHLELPEVICRARESEVRATCDTCMTSIFSSSWMCRQCGREACAECFAQVKELTQERPGAGHAEVAALQARREMHAHVNPFFLSCTRRNEHQAKEFSPMSRFDKAELANAILDMEAVLAETEPDAAPETVNTTEDPSSIVPDGHNQERPASSSSTLTDLSDVATDAVTAANGDGKAAQASHDTSDIPSHHTARFSQEDLTEDVFRTAWGIGDPIVVTGLLPKFKVQWTPEYFKEKYGTQQCQIVDCQTDANQRLTVGEFFSWFGKYENRKEVWKLKDWPPSTDFKTAFPELYEDFNEAVPVPSYVRRDGLWNIGSHFPSNTIAPDLGPKMYNAMANVLTSGSQGSTKLHMDMADAMNIMTYASPQADGSDGSAVWDLFKASDADKIRKYLRDKFGGAPSHDPIHAQNHYLDSVLRADLYRKMGVISHRIYQRPGEAVFIPAGCAHQVCNLSDCMKVAVDFVSPENVARCETLTREFREQNQMMVWKEDVLQLRTMLWFAWLSCIRQESQLS